MFIENATLYQVRGEVPDEEHLVPIGVSKVQREGHDATIVTYSKMLQKSFVAAERLSSEGIEVEIVDSTVIQVRRPPEAPNAFSPGFGF